MKTFFRFILRGLLLLIVAMVSALTAMRFAIHGGVTSVPDLKGKTPSEASRLAEENGFELEIERQYYSPTIAEGRILSQIPPPHTEVRRGWRIRVAQSLGPQRIEVPSVVGESERAAELNVRRQGFDLGLIAQIPMPGDDVGEVLSQSPPANASGVSVPKINLLIHSAAPPQSFVMPSFSGETLESVLYAVKEAGLHPGTVTTAGVPVNTTAELGAVVVSQNPPPGEKVTAGSAVNLEVR
ncbi:MAG: PASTA domain-containing protein [Acidobacteriales bacterium]|nr:PASTA domain-containing protein [Terriglobales bacterium]